MEKERGRKESENCELLYKIRRFGGELEREWKKMKAWERTKLARGDGVADKG
jgi:hypothetical protein